uniref:hypothetical protein n=1 Tax=Methylobacterium sp. B34 TaxID=95563 RepID=UPI0005B27426|nr:hypothetical protein [Methylobacterium sp. B34]
MSTKIIDLDAVDQFPDIVAKLGGKRHKLVPVSVEDFIANTKLLQTLGKDGDIDAEVSGLIQIILRAFPSMTEDMLRKLPLVNLNKLMGIAQDNDGTKKVQGEASEGNPAAEA